MKIFGKAPKKSNLGIKGLRAAYWNLTPKELTEITLNAGQGELTSTGALSIKTGKFTGRSPKDRLSLKMMLQEKSLIGAILILCLMKISLIDYIKKCLTILKTRKFMLGMYMHVL